MNLDTEPKQLEHTDLIRQASEAELAYWFKHGLVQDTAYGSLLKNDRKRLHRLVAESLEREYPKSLDENAARLAQHYAEAGDDEKALEYARRAGDAAARLYANSEAIVQYRLALDLALKLGESCKSQLVPLMTHLGRTLEISSRYKEAVALYEEMEKIAQERGDRALELNALVLQATLHSTPTPLYDIYQGNLLAQRTLALARELGDSQAEAKVLWNLELLAWFSGKSRDAVTYGEESLARARQANLTEQVAYSLNDLSLPYLAIGDTEKAEAVLVEARGLWEQLDNRPMLTDNLGSSANLNYFLGNFDVALQNRAEALELSQSIGNLWGQSYSQMFAGRVYVDRGEIARGVEMAKECIRLSEKAGFIPPQVMCRADLGLVHAQMGEIEQGEALARQAHEVAERALPLFDTYALAIIAHIHLLKGNLQLAHESIAQLRRVLQEDYLTELFAPASIGVALAEIYVAFQERDHARVEKKLDRLIAFLTQARLRVYLPETHHLKGRVLMARGLSDEARSELEQARRVAEEIGSRWTLWGILATQSKLEAQSGNAETAERLRAEAREQVEFIAAHSSPDLGAAFLALPEVKAVTVDA